MKKVLLLVMIAVLLIGAADALNIKRFTVINKSGHPLYIDMVGQEFGAIHWLPIPEGSRARPKTVVWTVLEDLYAIDIWYETEDDLYSCLASDDPQFYLDIYRNTRLVVSECASYPPKGEPSMVKWPPWNEANWFKYIY